MEEWDRYLSINLTGVFLCYRAAARIMVEQGLGGKIIGARFYIHKSASCGLKQDIPGACSTAGKRGENQYLLEGSELNLCCNRFGYDGCLLCEQVWCKSVNTIFG